MFKAEEIQKIYMGPDHICRCGCAGEYVIRGQPKFEMRLKKFMKKTEKAKTDTSIEVDDGGNYVNVSYGKNRAMCAYDKD